MRDDSRLSIRLQSKYIAVLCLRAEKTVKKKEAPQSGRQRVWWVLFGSRNASFISSDAFFQCQKWSQFNVYTIKANIKGHKTSKKKRHNRNKENFYHIVRFSSWPLLLLLHLDCALYMCSVHFHFWIAFNNKTRSSHFSYQGQGIGWADDRCCANRSRLETSTQP